MIMKNIIFKVESLFYERKFSMIFFPFLGGGGWGGGGKLSIENTNFLLFDKTGKKLGTKKEGKKVYSK